MTKPIVWSIAGSDSSGCAGIQADIKTFHGLGVHGCTIVTAVTAQSDRELSAIQSIDIESQLTLLKKDMPPKAIKIGMLGNAAVIETAASFLQTYRGVVILDPVMITTSGGQLFNEQPDHYALLLKKLFPYINLLTPNLPELAMLLQRPIHSFSDIEQGARDLISLGIKSVLIKGGHVEEGLFAQDYWSDGTHSYWIASKRHIDQTFSGTGCTLSSAIAACCALGYAMEDALVIAKMYVNQAMRRALAEENDQPIPAKKILNHDGWPENEMDLPMIANHPITALPLPFPDCGNIPLGLYPIIDSLKWLNKLLALGVKTIQLRIKQQSGDTLETMIQQAIAMAMHHRARLFINDHWELAIRYGAYGVHLGQEDIAQADVVKIRAAGLRLGISTHSYHELARAHACKPSYIAYGPIFPTQSKPMTYAAQGLQQLRRLRRMLNYPLVAIGGIDQEHVQPILDTKADGIALISAITKAADPIHKTKLLLSMVDEYVGGT